MDYGLENLRGNSSSSSPSGFTTFDDLEQLQNYILAEMVSVVKSVENQSSPISSLNTTVTKKNEEEENEIQEPDQQRYVPDEKRTERTRNDFLTHLFSVARPTS